jgi:hypothetical protein
MGGEPPNARRLRTHKPHDACLSAHINYTPQCFSQNTLLNLDCSLYMFRDLGRAGRPRRRTPTADGLAMDAPSEICRAPAPARGGAKG